MLIFTTLIAGSEEEGGFEDGQGRQESNWYFLSFLTNLTGSEILQIEAVTSDTSQLSRLHNLVLPLVQERPARILIVTGIIIKY